MTLLFLLNYLLIQFTFFRLCRIVDLDTNKQTHWGVMGPVVPFTGWHGRYWGYPKTRLMWKTLSRRGSGLQ